MISIIYSGGYNNTYFNKVRRSVCHNIWPALRGECILKKPYHVKVREIWTLSNTAVLQSGSMAVCLICWSHVWLVCRLQLCVATFLPVCPDDALCFLLTKKSEKYIESSSLWNVVWVKCKHSVVSSHDNFRPRFIATVLANFFSSLIGNREVIISAKKKTKKKQPM